MKTRHAKERPARFLLSQFVVHRSIKSNKLKIETTWSWINDVYYYYFSSYKISNTIKMVLWTRVRQIVIVRVFSSKFRSQKMWEITVKHRGHCVLCIWITFWQGNYNFWHYFRMSWTWNMVGQKVKFCHCLLTLRLFQTHMIYFLLWKTKRGLFLKSLSNRQHFMVFFCSYWGLKDAACIDLFWR